MENENTLENKNIEEKSNDTVNVNADENSTSVNADINEKINDNNIINENADKKDNSEINVSSSNTASGENINNVNEKINDNLNLNENPDEKNKDEVNEKPRVLIVEDDETARLSLKVALEAENIFVEAVENGANAENMVKFSSFDVVIVDYRLPDIDGLNLIKKMKILVPDLMSLIVTAHTSVEIAVESMKMGAYDYMAKPLDIPNLISTIYKMIKDKRNLYDSRQKVTEMVTKKHVDYLFNDERIAIITAPNTNVLVEGKSKDGIFKSIKKFFIGIKNYYWGA